MNLETDGLFASDYRVCLALSPGRVSSSSSKISSLPPCSLRLLLNDVWWHSLQRDWRLMGWWSLRPCWLCRRRKPVCLPAVLLFFH